MAGKVGHWQPGRVAGCGHLSLLVFAAVHLPVDLPAAGNFQHDNELSPEVVTATWPMAWRRMTASDTVALAAEEQRAKCLVLAGRAHMPLRGQPRQDFATSGAPMVDGCLFPWKRMYRRIHETYATSVLRLRWRVRAARRATSSNFGDVACPGSAIPNPSCVRGAPVAEASELHATMPADARIMRSAATADPSTAESACELIGWTNSCRKRPS